MEEELILTEFPSANDSTATGFDDKTSRPYFWITGARGVDSQLDSL